jgi:hypothetical protein
MGPGAGAKRLPDDERTFTRSLIRDPFHGASASSSSQRK